MRIAIYARYSSDNQRQESIDAQIRAIKEFCTKNKYDIVKIYIDEAQSATTDQRDQFLQMVNDSSDKFFDAVVVHKLDRFARNRYDSAFYKHELKKHGVKVFSVLEQLDDSPESVILESVLEGLAEYYSMNLAREVRKGLKENALKGLHNGGTPPLGYDVKQDRTYSINEKEAQAVRMIFDMYADGYGYMMICNKLNNEGYKTKLGRSFAKNSISEILRNEKYLGRYVFNKRLSKKSGNRKFKSDDEIVRIDNALPSIVSQELWDKVHSKMNTQLKPRMNATRNYLLTGKLECGLCGSAYVGASYIKGSKEGSKYYMYACTSRDNKNGCTNKSIRADKLENYVIDFIKHELLNDEAIIRLTGMVLDIVDQAIGINKRIAVDLIKRRNEISAMLDKLLDAYLTSNFDKKQLDDKSDQLKKEAESINARLLQLNYSDFDNLDNNRIKQYLIDMRDKLDDADDNVKRTIIDAMIDKIIIYPDEVKVTYKIDPLNTTSKTKSSLTQGKVGGGEPCLTLPYVYSRADIYAYSR